MPRCALSSKQFITVLRKVLSFCLIHYGASKGVPIQSQLAHVLLRRSDALEELVKLILQKDAPTSRLKQTLLKADRENANKTKLPDGTSLGDQTAITED